MVKHRTGSIPVLGTNLFGYKLYIAGWSSLVARRAHNPKVVGSNPAPATNLFYGEVAQLARAFGSYPECRRFKSVLRYHFLISFTLLRFSTEWSLLIFGPMVKRLRHRPLTAGSRVRIPMGSPKTIPIRPYGQAVKTPPFHGGIPGSNPGRVTTN